MAEEKKSLFSRLRDSMRKTRETLASRVEALFHSYQQIDDEFFEELTDVLIASDVGGKLAMDLVDDLRQQVRKEKVREAAQVRALLQQTLQDKLQPAAPLQLPAPTVILMVGVNGAGKTTACGKLAARFRAQGHSVLLAAADTFRAAAVAQLQVWGQRAAVEVITQQAGSDPAAVVYDAVHAAQARKTDILICDTAGRLQNKANLMQELSKIRRVIAREYPQAHCETFLVLDATTGQNALSQAEVFSKACEVSGLILTKLDGSAKGGVALAICTQMAVPVRFVGTGEGLEDIQEFDAAAYVQAMFE